MQKACAEQLRSLSDRANPSQEHAQTLGKVKRQYKTCISQGTCGTSGAVAVSTGAMAASGVKQ